MRIFRPQGFSSVEREREYRERLNAAQLGQNPVKPKPVEYTSGGHVIGRHSKPEK